MQTRALRVYLFVSLVIGLPQPLRAQIVVPPDYEASTFATGIAGPQGVALDSAGNLYVAATGADQVVKVTPQGLVSSFASSCDNPLAFATTIWYPTKMTFGHDDFLYVGAVGWYFNPCNPYGDVYDKLLRISAAGAVTVAASGTGCCADPFDDISGVTTTADGRIFFVDTWMSRSIFVYSPADGSLARWATFPYPWGWYSSPPSAIVPDIAGNLLVSFQGDPGGVLRFAPDGQVTSVVAGRPVNAIRFDAHGGLWLAESGTVYRVASDGSLGVFASGFQGAADLVFDADGNLYVSEYGTGSIIKIALAVIPVAIDIKPGSYPNSINLGSNGDVPVAVLSSPTFDAGLVDPASLTLAGAEVALRGKGTLMSSFEDVNGDGFMDLVVHVEAQALEIASDDSTAVLEGRTVDGRRIRGSDSVRIVP